MKIDSLDQLDHVDGLVMPKVSETEPREGKHNRMILTLDIKHDNDSKSSNAIISSVLAWLESLDILTQVQIEEVIHHGVQKTTDN